MVIVNVGSALAAVIPDAVGRPVSDVFVLARPLTTLCWEEVRVSGWLATGLVVWLLDWLLDWLAGCLTGWLAV